MKNQLKLTSTILIFVVSILIMGYFIANKDFIVQNKPEYITKLSIPWIGK